jgi:hypothetical protein
MYSITITMGGMPVDKMEESEEGKNCPVATQDSEVNEANKLIAVEEANYRDPQNDGGFKLSDVCGNCVAFNQTHDIMECMGNNPNLGYCQMYKFMCSADHTCDSWAEGGPITDADDGSEHDIL